MSSTRSGPPGAMLVMVPILMLLQSTLLMSGFSSSLRYGVAGAFLLLLLLLVTVSVLRRRG